MKTSRAAFSLIELLTVVTVLALLLALGAAGLAGMSRSVQIDFAAEQVRGQLELARQTAAAMNTYCYVALGRSGDDLWVATLQSLDGRPAGGTNAAPVSLGSNYSFLSRVQRTPHVIVEDELPPADRGAYRDLPSAAYLDAALRPANASPQFTVPLPGSASPATSTHAIEFNPAGEATVRTAATRPAGAVQMVLVPTRGATPGEAERAKSALLWINGATGHAEIYRR